MALKNFFRLLKKWLVALARRLWKLFVKEVKEDVSDHMSTMKNSDIAASEEIIRLYHAWLGYLLSRMGEGELRVPVEDIRHALDDLACETAREENDYVIRMVRKQGEGSIHDRADDQDDTH